MTLTLRRGASLAARTAAFGRLLARLEQAEERRPNLLRVLTYHRVDEPEARPALCPGLRSATPEAFDQQMAWLADHYRVVSMAEVLGARAGRAALPPRAVLITFDDAYADFAEHAWPILKRYRLPATLFVPTAFPGERGPGFWWDRLHHAVAGATGRDTLETPIGRLPLRSAAERAAAASRLNRLVKSLPHRRAIALVHDLCEALGATTAESCVLDWDALRALAREGVTLGAHTRTHPILTRTSPDQARLEVVGALRDLKREIGSVLPVFSYPAGGCNETVAALLRSEGLALAFTTVRGVVDLNRDDPLRLRRINVGRRTTLTALRAQLMPCSISLNRWWPLCDG